MKLIAPTEKEILADGILRYYFGLNGGKGPVSERGVEVIRAIIDLLQPQVEAVESEQARDAGRYRWLRDKAGPPDVAGAVTCQQGPYFNTHIKGERLDKMIDAAMSASGAPAAAPAGKALRWLTVEEIEAACGLLKASHADIYYARRVQMRAYEVNGLPTPAGEGE